VDAFMEGEKLGLFLAFAVPGIILLYFRSRFLAGRMPSASDGLLAYVTLSLIYHGIAFSVFGNIYDNILTSSARIYYLFFIFIFPAVIGILLGLSAKKGWLDWPLKILRMGVVHPVDCAWDWHFANCNESWTLVKLKDGTRWAGVLGEKSFISSDPAERDLFLEKVYIIGDDNVWVENSSCVWIAHGEIQTIEMWPKGKD
jgi:hypothetical protein